MENNWRLNSYVKAFISKTSAIFLPMMKTTVEQHVVIRSLFGTAGIIKFCGMKASFKQSSIKRKNN